MTHAGHTYDRIATHFSQTREYAWPEIEAFLDGRSGATGLDLGCGNGRHAEVLAVSTAEVESRGTRAAVEERLDFGPGVLAGL